MTTLPASLREPLGWLHAMLTGALGGLAARPAPEPLDVLEREPQDENTHAGAYAAHEAVSQALHAPLVEFLERVAQALREEGFTVGAPEQELDSQPHTLSWVCSFGAEGCIPEDADLVLGLSLCTEQAPAGAPANHAARHDVYVGLGYLQTNENLVGERLEDAPQKTSVRLPAPEAGCVLTLKTRIERVRMLLEAADEATLAASFAAALER